MPIQRIRMLCFEGPNIAGPRPGVLLHAIAPREIGAALRNGLRNGVQRAGLTIAALEIASAPAPGGLATQVWFETPTPQLGAALLGYLLDGLDAHEAGDADWDDDDQMLLLQERVAALRLPIGAIQAMAEASVRGVPTFQRADGQIQFGYGARGRAVPVADLAAGAGVAGPWQGAGSVPVVATCGAAALARGLADDLARLGWRAACATAASFDQCLALLADPDAEIAIIDLAPADMLARGLVFGSCALAALLGAPPRLDAALDADEPLRAAALPLLVAEQGVISLQIQQVEQLLPFLPRQIARAPSAEALGQVLAELVRQRWGSR